MNGEQPLPDILKQIVKQKFRLTVTLKEAKKLNEETVYEAIQIVEVMASMTYLTPSIQETMQKQDMSITNVSKFYITLIP